MFDSRVLETAMGLVFFFLALSLVTTTIQEMFATIVGLRAITLKQGLRDMLADGQQGLDFYNKVIGHALIAPAGDNPSYISAQQFSAAAIHLLSGEGSLPMSVQSLRIALTNMPDAPYKQAMLGMFREGETDLTNFESRLQNWFDQSMDRVSGNYKRFAQYISLAIGFVLAFAFELDAIAVVTSLWHDQALLDAITKAGASLVQAGHTPDASQMTRGLSQFDVKPFWIQGFAHFDFTKLCGCLMTMFAVTLGAPFWFDLLQTFVSLRGTGPQPARANASATGATAG